MLQLPHASGPVVAPAHRFSVQPGSSGLVQVGLHVGVAALQLPKRPVLELQVREPVQVPSLVPRVQESGPGTRSQKPPAALAHTPTFGSQSARLAPFTVTEVQV